jgi:hypothetical protein
MKMNSDPAAAAGWGMDAIWKLEGKVNATNYF